MSHASMEKSTPLFSSSPSVAFETSESSEVRRRVKPSVTAAPFAGRLGGNQDFIADKHDEDAKRLLKKHPDAVCYIRSYIRDLRLMCDRHH
jgi:hypothetical protein